MKRMLLLVFALVFISTGVANAIPIDGLVSYWQADGNALDSEGANHGTLKLNASYADGVSGQAFKLDGHYDHVYVPHSDSLNIGVEQDFSISAWVNLSNPVDGWDDEIVGKADIRLNAINQPLS